MKAFISSQFSSCHLISMFHGKMMGQRIKSIQKKDLKLVYEDSHDSMYQDFLAKSNSFVYTK